MAFRGHLRPGQGFKPFKVWRREGGISNTGRPTTAALAEKGIFLGIISQVSPTEAEQFKQLGSPITHTIVQRGVDNMAHATDVLELKPPRHHGLNQGVELEKSRFFLVQGEPQNPGELGHFLVYRVLERTDLS